MKNNSRSDEMKSNLARYKPEIAPGTSALEGYNARYAVTTKYTSINGTLGTAVNDWEWRMVAW